MSGVPNGGRERLSEREPVWATDAAESGEGHVLASRSENCSGGTRPLMLDLYCGAGGAGYGYSLAGFDVVGVDIEPQPYYPFKFIQRDALDVLRQINRGLSEWHLTFDAIHASPPCQRYSTMGNRSRALKADTSPDLLPPTLKLLRDVEIPWVVENVAGAKQHMPNAFVLSGGMFGLGVHRPRYFVSNCLILTPPKTAPPAHGIGVYGRAHDGRRLFNRKSNGTYRAPRSLEEAQEAMGMNWADWHGTKEAIPPAYTEFIGRQLIRHVSSPFPRPKMVEVGSGL